MEFNFWVDHFLRASLVAKAIYALLLGLSVASWTIIFRKTVQLRRHARQNREFITLYRKHRRDPFALFRHFGSSIRGWLSPLPLLFNRGCAEIESLREESGEDGRRREGTDGLSILQLESLEEILSAELSTILGGIDRGQTTLATTSSIAPLLGLLGTVWGILEAFLAIGVQGSATAASMAPGMAEALITTVSGLVVAIPANLGFNFLGQRTKDLGVEGDAFITEFITNLERFGGVR